MIYYKIEIDFNLEQPFIIYRKDDFIFSKYKKIESTPTHAEAIIFCKGKDGIFVGTFQHDTKLSDNIIIRVEREKIQERNKLNRKEIDLYPEDENIVSKRIVRKNII